MRRHHAFAPGGVLTDQAPRRHRPPCPTEHQEQVALCQWAERAAVSTLPCLALLFAIPNAVAFGRGDRRSAMRVIQHKRSGLRRGVPDLCLPVARRGFHALYLELKRREGGSTTADQRWWHERLATAGNCVRICKGWDDARRTLEWYLGEKGGAA